LIQRRNGDVSTTSPFRRLNDVAESLLNQRHDETSILGCKVV